MCFRLVLEAHNVKVNFHRIGDKVGRKTKVEKSRSLLAGSAFGRKPKWHSSAKPVAATKNVSNRAIASKGFCAAGETWTRKKADLPTFLYLRHHCCRGVWHKPC
jgi:hypothetical protein